MLHLTRNKSETVKGDWIILLKIVRLDKRQNSTLSHLHLQHKSSEMLKVNTEKGCIIFNQKKLVQITKSKRYFTYTIEKKLGKVLSPRVYTAQNSVVCLSWGGRESNLCFRGGEGLGEPTGHRPPSQWVRRQVWRWRQVLLPHPRCFPRPEGLPGKEWAWNLQRRWVSGPLSQVQLQGR